jgi:hypothetical protein
MTMPGFDNDNNNSEGARSVETMEAGTTLLSIAHAMADYVLGSGWEGFSRLLEVADATEADNLRENIQFAHDAYAGMAARAKGELGIAKILASLSGESGGSDGDIDIDVIGL